MRAVTVLSALLMLAVPLSARAEGKPAPAKEKPGTQYYTFNIENDMFGSGQDRNYTSGVRLTYFNLQTPLPAFAAPLDRLLPTFSVNQTTSVYYSLGQNIFTPHDITKEKQDPRDRPWAAFLYGSAGLHTARRTRTDNVELTLGVVGPAALGEEVQKFVHKHISDSPEPEGWGNQLHNEPGLMLSWERSWPDRYRLDLGGLTAAPYLGATAGNIYTYASAGMDFTLSPQGRWQDGPLRPRPSMPGTGAFTVPDGAFGWGFFGGVETRAVARNIFLDGNTFRESHSVDKMPFVADANAGVALAFGRTRVSYAMVYRTKEFETQKSQGDLFGSLSLGVRF